MTPPEAEPLAGVPWTAEHARAGKNGDEAEAWFFAEDKEKEETPMMTPAEMETYRGRLLDLAQQYSRGVSRLEKAALHGLGGESGGGISNIPTHFADLGNASSEEDLDIALMEVQGNLLEECNAALTRLEAGRFGVCEKCHRPIARGRLDVCPYARYCVACARKVESEMA